MRVGVYIFWYSGVHGMVYCLPLYKREGAQSPPCFCDDDGVAQGRKAGVGFLFLGVNRIFFTFFFNFFRSSSYTL